MRLLCYLKLFHDYTLLSLIVVFHKLIFFFIGEIYFFDYNQMMMMIVPFLVGFYTLF